MEKLTRNPKTQLYEDRRQGKTVRVLSKKYKIRKDDIQDLVRLLDLYGHEFEFKSLKELKVEMGKYIEYYNTQ